MSETGLVGSTIQGIEDLLRRRLDRVVFVEYGALVSNPEGSLRKVESVCGMDSYPYDFVNVEPTATDLDELYRNKFPHEGSGSVKPGSGQWSDVISADIGRASLERWPLFSRTFGYLD
jgi:hypothetical protein